MHAALKRIVASGSFQRIITGVIVANGVLVGVETSRKIYAEYGPWLEVANQIIIGIFVAEVAARILAEWPRPGRFFTDGWNNFDFIVVAFSLVPAAGHFATVARLVRLLRVLRLVSAVPELRLIVSTLVRSLPGMGHVVMLLSLIFYIYGVAGYHLFHQHDPTHWNTLGLALLSLFRIVTLEDWTDIMYTAMELHPLAWIYFVSFVVIGTFVVINLFIAVVLKNLEEAKVERLREITTPVSREELLAELRATQAALERLHGRLAEAPPEPKPAPGLTRPQDT